MLQYSDDSGKTWSNERWARAGALGQYRKRVRWTRLGRSRDRIFRVVMTDPVYWVLIDAYLEITLGKT